VAAVQDFAAHAGLNGVIGGEMADVEAEGQPHDEATLQFIHIHKTAKLFQASARAGAILAVAPEAGLAALSQYALTAGLIFQITDDILNVVGDPARTGKSVGSDAAHAKATYPGLLGLEAARERGAQLRDQAHQQARRLPRNVGLWCSLVDFLLERDR